jgi:hypothetical protein
MQTQSDPDALFRAHRSIEGDLLFQSSFRCHAGLSLPSQRSYLKLPAASYSTTGTTIRSLRDHFC